MRPSSWLKSAPSELVILESYDSASCSASFASFIFSSTGTERADGSHRSISGTFFTHSSGDGRPEYSSTAVAWDSAQVSSNSRSKESGEISELEVIADRLPK